MKPPIKPSQVSNNVPFSLSEMDTSISAFGDLEK
ncbi:hypothetical protein COLO4_14063 [Corchorus olitorius]|uniref:Uncharacterized protein n=1 Tax=Corchorus olitorius TaxID=93759 RepID=A0A1R3JTI0_9ROSI|nr:hypothetical protein COLO4_14063 [Corchorus olitorius]